MGTLDIRRYKMTYVHVRLIVGLIIVVAVSTRRLQVQQCGEETSGLIHAVKIRPCRPLSENGGPDGCQLKVGSRFTIKIKFTPSSNSTTVTQAAFGTIFSLSLPFPGFAGDACGFTRCPMISGRRQLYQNDNITLSSMFPLIRTEAKWILKDSSSNYVTCFKIPIQLIAADS